MRKFENLRIKKIEGGLARGERSQSDLHTRKAMSPQGAFAVP